MQWQNSMKFSKADTHVKMWRFPNVSGTNYIAVVRVCWRFGRTRRKTFTAWFVSSTREDFTGLMKQTCWVKLVLFSQCVRRIWSLLKLIASCYLIGRYQRPYKEVRPEFEPAPYYEPSEFQYTGRGGGRGRGGRFGQRKEYVPGSGGGKDYYDDSYSGSRYIILQYINVRLLVPSALPGLFKNMDFVMYRYKKFIIEGVTWTVYMSDSEETSRWFQLIYWANERSCRTGKWFSVSGGFM